MLRPKKKMPIVTKEAEAKSAIALVAATKYTSNATIKNEAVRPKITKSKPTITDSGPANKLILFFSSVLYGPFTLKRLLNYFTSI